MDFIGTLKNIVINQNQNVDITISTHNKTIVEQLEKYKKFNKELNVEIKRKSKKRTKDANSLCWYLCEEIAKVINSDKDLVYLDMINKYGVFAHLVVKPNIVEKIKEEYKIVREIGEVSINSKKGVQLQVYWGSSKYDQFEMYRFIEGIKNECIDLGIPVPEDNEINNMVKEWDINE